jgi:hypothetical protein
MQPGQDPGVPNSYGARRDAQNGGDVGGRQLLQVTKHQHFAVAFAEAGQGHPQAVAQLGTEKGDLRSLASCRLMGFVFQYRAGSKRGRDL